MGYNRRAIALKKLAQKVTSSEFKGKLPSSLELLITLPGIGRATASAVAAFAFQQPVVFIETNIRRVFLHFCFRGQDNVRDFVILPLVEKTLDSKDPRQWYFGLMDYGAMLKKTVQNPNRRSAHYQKQSPFEGSNRQVRGMILKALLSNPNISEHKLIQKLNANPLRVRQNLKQLQKEGFIKKKIKGLVVA
jgi:A/G-specific adenine glycosylase